MAAVVSDINNGFDMNIDDDDMNMKRIIKGSERRIHEERPNFFDIIFLNSEKSQELPTICAPYLLLDREAAQTYLGLKHAKIIKNEILKQCLESIKYFLHDDPFKYWHYTKILLENRLEAHSSDLLDPFTDDISKIIDLPVNELEAVVLTLEKQMKIDLDEHTDFYEQLYHRLQAALAIGWLDRFQTLLLKSKIKKLPKKLIVDNSGTDIPHLTKTQIKFRNRVLQQDDGLKQLNKYAKMCLDATRTVEFEIVRERVYPRSQAEGFQYWGDEEFVFDDLIDLHPENPTGEFVLPNYEAKVYKGIDWNPYNRSRYDPKNPPPKTIRGYKFMLFYPSLAKGSAPRFKFVPSYVDPNDPTADPAYKYTSIVFLAGPPYLPLAFRIVDKQLDIYRNGGITTSWVQNVFTVQLVFKASLYYKGNLPETLY